MAIGLPIILLFGLTLIFMSNIIPSGVRKFNRYSSSLWNLGIVALSIMTAIINLARR